MRRVLLATTLIASLISAEEEYIFKAKGEFAKELKQLMEKYATEGKVEIQEAKSGSSGFRNSSVTLVDAFLNNEETEGDIAFGKEIYEKTCFQCHGQKAERSSYSNARVLNTLTKKELTEQLSSYARDSGYGNSTNIIMHQYASGLNTEEIVSISAYIYSLNPSASATSTPAGQDKSTKENNAPSQGTYLK